MARRQLPKVADVERKLDHLPGACPDSGFYNEAVHRRIEALPSHEAVDDYASLVALGWSEDELLMVLVADAALAEIAESDRCGAPIDFAVADAVAERNQWLLDRFPGGLLARQLAEPGLAPARYVRRRGEGAWLLVDTHLRPPGDPSIETMSKVLGVSWPGPECIEAPETYEMREIRSNALLIDGELLGSSEAADDDALELIDGEQARMPSRGRGRRRGG